MKLNPFRREESRDSLENPSVDLYTALVGSSDGFLDNGTGVPVTPERAMKQIAFFACVSIIAKTIASTELFLYSRNGRARDLVLDDPRFDLLHDDPNDDMTAFDLLQFTVVSMCIFGNAFWWLESDGKGNVIAIWPIAVDRIKPGRAPNGDKVWVVDFSGEGTDESKAVLLYEEVIPFHGIGLDANKGLAPYAQLREELGIAAAATDYAGRLFQNFAVPGGVYTTDKPMNDQQFQTFLARQKAAHEGLRNSHRMAVLPPGMTYTETNFDPSNLQMTEARQYQNKMVAMAFNLPPRMLGIADGTSSYSSVEMDAINTLIHTFRPWFVNLQQRIRKGMFNSPSDKAKRLFVEFETTVLLTPDSVSRAKVDASDRMWAVKTANEIREARGLPPVEGGDVLWMPVNMSPLDSNGLPMFDAGAPVSAPATPITGELDPLSDPPSTTGSL